MTNTAPQTFQTFMQRPSVPLYLLCGGIVATCLFATLFLLILVERNQTQWTNEYGQALANLAAHRALDSTLNHDLVSLQVILSDVDENASVVNATIHDVESNLLVQSGSRNFTGNADRRLINFSAPITLHNSIAGYVTITLDLNSHSPINKSLLLLHGLMTACLIAITLCYAFFVRSRQSEEKIAQHTIPIVETPPIRKPDTDDDEYLEPSLKHYQVQLVVCLLNYQDLSRQLNSSSFRNVNQRLEQQLVGVLSLYSGKITYFEQHFAHLQFSSHDSNADATFNAMCAALLLKQLNQQPNTIPLQIACLICEESDTRSILKHLPYYLSAQEDFKQLLFQSGEDKVFAQSQLLEEDGLESRCHYQVVEDEDGIVEILSVPDNYQALLDKQLQQLSKA